MCEAPVIGAFLLGVSGWLGILSNLFLVIDKPDRRHTHNPSRDDVDDRLRSKCACFQQ